MNDQHDSEGPTLPDLASIAFFVKMQRSLWRWKQPTLASLAGVSLSTVQRIERGEPVSSDNLSKVGAALGFPADYLTTPRRKLSEEEALRRLADSVAWMEGMVEVPVSPLGTEKQLRELSSTDMIVLGSDLDEAAAADLADLREWIDFIGFMRRGHDDLIGPKPERDFRVRDLYRDAFQHLERTQVRYNACLSGRHLHRRHRQPEIPDRHGSGRFLALESPKSGCGETHRRMVRAESLMESRHGAYAMKQALHHFAEAFATQLGKSIAQGIVAAVAFLAVTMLR